MPSENKETYYIPMPPPNITGQLHLGHSLFLTIQDSIARYYRKSGYNTLWLPGTDHAGLATHQKIIDSFNGEIPNDIQYLERAAELKDKHQATIINQIKKMGASCDWSRLNYTLDDNFKTASTFALSKLNDENLLYHKNGQWYISMKEMADDLLKAIHDDYFIINDQSEMNKLIHMLENIEDWCISRQIKWGFELPIYTANDGSIHIFENDIQAIETIGIDYIKETSTFDTWFTSSLWPMATLGWPNKTDDYLKYYPAQIIETGADILFFWCARMLMIGKKMTGIYPFKEIYLHGICLDKNGQKMSKSLGNGIDPLDIIDIYGTDALRFALLSKSTNKDMKISKQDFLTASKFINKIWQSFKFFGLQIEKQNLDIQFNENGDFKNNIDILKNSFIEKMEKRDFLNLIRELQHSYKHEFCDIWIEKNKRAIFDGNTAIIHHGLFILLSYLNMFHCFIPFITENIAEYFGIRLIDKKY